jgi:glycerol-3-phosphate cytidylyltransferase
MYDLGITFGVFDYTHIGHINLIAEAKNRCKKLIVCISTDNYVKKVKGVTPTFNFAERRKAVRKIKGVEFVLAQVDENSKKNIVDWIKPDVIFVGNDWNTETFSGENLGVKVEYLPYTKNISSTKIRKSPDDRTKTIIDLERILNFEIYLQFGSLLGAVREGGMIEGDSDVDVCYLSKKNNKSEVIKEITGIYKLLASKGVFVKSFNKDYVEDVDISQPFGQCHVNTRGVVIDLFTSWIEDGEYWTCQWGCLGKATDLLPFKIVEFDSLRFKAPKNSEGILKKLYGDWKTPKKEKASIYVERKAYLYV